MGDETKEKPKTPFERFDRLLRKVLSVPKKEIDRREAEWRKRQKGEMDTK